MNIQHYVQDVLSILSEGQWEPYFRNVDMYRERLKEVKTMGTLLQVIHSLMEDCIDVDDNGYLILFELSAVQLSILKAWKE